MIYYNSKFGIIGVKITTNKVAVTKIELLYKPENNSIPKYKFWNFSNLILDEISNTAYKEIFQYLNGERKVFSFPIEISGTDFQRKVWNELIKIPYGETKNYQEVATAIGIPKGPRAVGGANNKNKLPIIIPCHRVIGKNRELVGYASGLHIKKILLTIEEEYNKE